MKVKAADIDGYESPIQISFYDIGRLWIGDLIIHLDKWNYETNNCRSSGDLLGDKQELNAEQIWSFFINRNEEDQHTITATCNNNMALNITISNETCASWGWEWNLNITKIAFPLTDKASDFYKTYSDTEGNSIGTVRKLVGSFNDRELIIIYIWNKIIKIKPTVEP